MQKLSGESQNIVSENIEKLKELFPEAFTEGRIDFDVLKEELGALVETKEERYSFNWNGKSEARRIAQTPSTGTLRPAPEESVEWDTTQNLFIEGDNLEVLKLLQKSYHSRVKMIYIDPPYNTGKEFIYPDNFRDNLDTYLEYTGQKDHEGRKFGTNAETSGRYHTNWLNMMYPRLKLARNLLRDDGVIFISIDDNEVHNLRKICDEIFGEGNFVGEMVWEGANKNTAQQIGISHEYVLVYAKSKVKLETDWSIKKEDVEPVLREVERLKKKYRTDYESASSDLAGWFRSMKGKPVFAHRRFRFIDAIGAYKEDDPTAPGGRKFDLINPQTKTIIPLRRNRGWSFDQDEFNRLVSDGRISFVTESTIMVRRYLHETDQIVPQSVFYQPARSASERLAKLIGQSIFPYPKDELTLKTFIEMATKCKDTPMVLDFFAGSGTTAHAVMKLNAEDGGNRRCISVQLPEPTDEKSEAYKAGYKTIAEISKERIRRAAKKIAEEHSDYQGDLGFKVFKLDSSNIKAWDADYDNVEQSLLDAVDNIKRERTSEDLLYEILLKYGLDLTLPIETKDVASKTAYVIGLGALVICLNDDITLDTVEAIAALKEEYQPEVMRVVFKDASFADDVVKTNAIQILKQHGIDDVKSV